MLRAAVFALLAASWPAAVGTRGHTARGRALYTGHRRTLAKRGAGSKQIEKMRQRPKVLDVWCICSELAVEVILGMESEANSEARKIMPLNLPKASCKK